jgi:hypothetical protein
MDFDWMDLIKSNIDFQKEPHGPFLKGKDGPFVLTALNQGVRFFLFKYQKRSGSDKREDRPSRRLLLEQTRGRRCCAMNPAWNDQWCLWPSFCEKEESVEDEDDPFTDWYLMEFSEKEKNPFPKGPSNFASLLKGQNQKYTLIKH